MLMDDFFHGTKQYGETLNQLCEPLAKYLGTTQVIYFNVNKNGQAFSVCNNVGWVERFLEERYYILDPLMVHPDNIHNGFSFDNASDDKDFKDTLLYDAVIKFDWCHSFAYIEKMTSGGYFGFDFGTTKSNHLMINRLINESTIVKRMIRQIHQKIERRMPALTEARMDFATLKGDIFYQQKGLVFNEPADNEHKVALLNEMGMLSQNAASFLKKNPLSPQEIKCLRSYLYSHNFKTVSKELNLALSTVASYIENIKTKLECHHKNELLEKAELLESLGHI